MISSVSTSYSSYSNNNLSSTSTSSSSMQQTIGSILSSYDSSDLSQEDAKSIVQSFKDAGIKPSEEMESIMASLGFDAKEVGDLAGVKPKGENGMPPPPPKDDQNEISDLLSSLFDYDSEDESNEESFESILDYTSRILSLNDKSKNEVMGLFEAFKPENTALNEEDRTTAFTNSLNYILSNENNYNKTSFYA